jgi:hypothetical protein
MDFSAWTSARGPQRVDLRGTDLSGTDFNLTRPTLISKYAGARQVCALRGQIRAVATRIARDCAVQRRSVPRGRPPHRRGSRAQVPTASGDTPQLLWCDHGATPRALSETLAEGVSRAQRFPGEACAHWSRAFVQQIQCRPEIDLPHGRSCLRSIVSVRQRQAAAAPSRRLGGEGGLAHRQRRGARRR